MVALPGQSSGYLFFPDSVVAAVPARGHPGLVRGKAGSRGVAGQANPVNDNNPNKYK